MLFMRINNDQKAGCVSKALGWHARIMGLTRLLAGISLFAVLHEPGQTFGATAPAGQSVTLVWNANTDPNVTGCNVYYGVSSGNYTNMINAGNVTNATVFGLVAGVTYYFAATTYDSAGDQSGYSTEATYTVPTTVTTTPAQVQIRSAPAGQFILTVSGPVGKTYNILATQDLMAWTVIGTATLGASGLLDFTDTNAANFPKRFYRTQQTN
jgi:hypothetical protein